MKLPRKTKKALKKAVLFGKDPAWKTSEVKIIDAKKYTGYKAKRHRRTNQYGQPFTPFFKSTFVTGYQLIPR